MRQGAEDFAGDQPIQKRTPSDASDVVAAVDGKMISMSHNCKKIHASCVCVFDINPSAGFEAVLT